MNPAPLSPRDFQDSLGIPDDALGRLGAYLGLLEKWRRRLNLVGAKTMADPWRRHMLDSAQIVRLLPEAAETIVDLGSGAGFPGMVLAILGRHRVHLVESNGRKCAFLEAVNRETGAGAIIHNTRAEAMGPVAADVVTARACAPLGRLLDYAEPFLGKYGICLFLKGRGVEEELTESAKKWKMEANRIESLSDPAGVILRLERISRHHGRKRR